MVKRIKNQNGKVSMKIVYAIISLVVLIILGFLNPWLMSLAAVIVVFVFSRKK